MSLNCRAGDLAVIVKSRHGPENIGLIVKVISRSIDWNGEPTWYTSPAKTGPAWFRDCALRPIRPDESPEESTEAMRRLTQLPQKEKV